MKPRTPPAQPGEPALNLTCAGRPMDLLARPAGEPCGKRRYGSVQSLRAAGWRFDPTRPDNAMCPDCAKPARSGPVSRQAKPQTGAGLFALEGS
jgi:hypothetical protein